MAFSRVPGAPDSGRDTMSDRAVVLLDMKGETRSFGGSLGYALALLIAHEEEGYSPPGDWAAFASDVATLRHKGLRIGERDSSGDEGVRYFIDLSASGLALIDAGSFAETAGDRR